MKYTVEAGEAFPLIKFELEKGEKIKAEAGAMVAMSTTLELTGKVDGGIGKAIGRMFSGESFFMQNFEAKEADGWVMIANHMPGMIGHIELQEGDVWQVEKNGFLAGSEHIDVSTKMQGIGRGLFGGEGFFVVKISGSGTAFLSTYGAIQEIDLTEGEEILIDNGHLVAWQDHLKYEITKGAKGWVSAWTSGEGLACRFKGPGKILIQSRNPNAFVSWLYPLLPIPKQG